MNKIKPQRIFINEIEEETTTEIKPQKLENINYKIEKEGEEEINFNKEEKSSLKWWIIITFILLFFGLLIYDTTTYIISIYSNSIFFGLFFTLIGLTFILLILRLIYIQIKSINNLKKMGERQKISQELKLNPTNQTKDFIKELLLHFKKDKTLKEEILQLEKKIDEDLLLNCEIMSEFEERILKKIDEKAYKIINKNVNQAAIATAVSPVVIIDALFVMYRNISMISQIAKIYGFTPTLSFKISLTKQILNSIIFASAAELMSEYGSYLLGNSIIKKISLSLSDGIANGILTARIGFYTIKACRPIENQEVQKDKLKKIITSILD